MNSEPTRVDEWRHQRRMMAYGFLALVLLIGIGIAVSIYIRLAYPATIVAAPYPFWRFGFGFLWAIFGLFFLFWILRLIFWPWRRHYWYGGWSGRYYRPWQYDEATSILRARYARGEITKEQFDQMMQDIRSQN